MKRPIGPAEGQPCASVFLESRTYQSEGAIVCCKAAILAIGMVLIAQSPVPSDEDWAWLDEHREQAFEALMPIEPTPEQLVAYRRYRDLYYDVPEMHFAIVRQTSESGPRKLSAVVTSPASGSIQQQLLQRHMANRDLTLEELLPQVLIRRQTFAEDRCPAIESRVNALARVRISLREPDTITLHPMVHWFAIHTSRVRMDATFYDSDAPVVRWAEDTLRAVQACEGG